MPTILVNDEPIYYRHHRGKAEYPPLVLIHGAGGDHMHWPGELRRLRGYDVLALDLPGHGKSGGRARSSVADYAEVVNGFVEALGLPRFVLGGHSMGGAITLEYALRWPESLAGIVLVGTGARLRVAPQIIEGALADPAATAELVTEWSHGPETSPEQRHKYARRLRLIAPAVVHGDYLACDQYDRRGDIPSLALPALVICGTADRMMPPKFSQWLAEQLPNAELVLIPGAGHMLMLEPQRMPAISAIERFLRNTGAQKAS